MTWWRFDAPAGTEIVAFSSWCFAEARDSGGDDPNTTLVDKGDHWRVEVVDASGQPIGGPGGGETCAHPVGVDLCTIGVPGGQRTDHRLVTNRLRWQATCGGEITGGCPTSYGGYPLTTMVVYGTHITLQDDSAPSASLAGPLLAAGWHKPGEPVGYTAADNSGVRSATLSAGSANATDARACDFTYRVPCSNATNRPLQFSQPLPDGHYPVRLTVTDAAGNARAIEAPVTIDGTAPAVDLRPPRGRTLVVGEHHRDQPRTGALRTYGPTRWITPKTRPRPPGGWSPGGRGALLPGHLKRGAAGRSFPSPQRAGRGISGRGPLCTDDGRGRPRLAAGQNAPRPPGGSRRARACCWP